MSEHGAALQTYNQELVKCLEDLKSKRAELQEIINKEEAEKEAVEEQGRILFEKLTAIKRSLEKHIQMKEIYDRTIQDTEIGFKKILSSSKLLLNHALHEANRLECDDQRLAEGCTAE